jgi:cell division protein FtsI/penicillin-binding protein 2
MRDKLDQAFSQRTPVFLGVLGLVFLVIISKFAYLMLFMNVEDPGFDLAKKEGYRPVPPRGKVLDADGNPLAMSVRRFSLVANPRRIENPAEVADRLAKHLDLSQKSLLETLNQDRYFAWVARKLPPEKTKKLRELNLDGIRFHPEYERVYPYGRLAGSVLGFVGVDNQGLAGIERRFDDILSQARATTNTGFKKTDSMPGENKVSIRLSIDQTIQHIVQEELSKVVRKENPEDAMVVALEPETGRVRAMVNWPTYNPNHYWKYDTNRRRNRIVSEIIEPGSTLKPLTLATGLAQGSFSPSSSFDCKGYVYLSRAKHTIHCHSRHGTLTIPEILIQSCNVGMVKAAQRIPRKTYYRSLREFGLGTWTGIRLPGESKGELRRPSQWSALTQSVMAIGQGLSATALQVTNAISVIANDGVLLKPRIVRSINTVNARSQPVDPFRVRRVIPRSVANTMQEYMREVVRRGTGERAGLEDYDLAGKTGTAQKPNREEGGYYQNKFLASFVGFGPVEDPELVVGVFFDDPKENKYGGTVAAPVFREIMKRSLRYLESKDDSNRLVSR